MPETFPHLTSRLHHIEFCSDHLKNIELWYCLSVFESYIYGVVSQDRRIREGHNRMVDRSSRTPSLSSSIQVRLDVYYYILTWDKLKRIFDRLKELMNTIVNTSDTPLSEFAQEFRCLRRRRDHLLAAFRTEVRNEYEHPSLQPKKSGNIMEWASLFTDGQGNITLHVGGEQYASVREQHVDRLKSLWVALIDLLLKHFSDKPSTSSLLQVKQYIEDNIDSLIEEYAQYRSRNKNEEANHIIQQLLTAEIYLSGEGIPLRDLIRDKLHSALWRRSSGP